MNQPQVKTVTKLADQDDGLTPLLREMLDKQETFVPFMAKDPITLSARTVLDNLATPTAKGHWPTIQHGVKFMMLCKARGLNPWEGDAFLVGYDTNDGAQFNLITAHQAFLKRAELHPEFDGMESGVVVASNGQVIDQQGDYFHEGQALVGGWARVHFKHRTIPIYRRAKLAVFNTGYSRWKKDPGGMICKVAEADALRSSFPTSLGGLYIREEMDHLGGDMKPARVTVPMPRATDDPPEPEVEPVPDVPEPTLSPPTELSDHVDEMLGTEKVDELHAWREWFATRPSIEDFNKAIGDMKELPESVKPEARKLVEEHLELRQWKIQQGKTIPR